MRVGMGTGGRLGMSGRFAGKSTRWRRTVSLLGTSVRNTLYRILMSIRSSLQTGSDLALLNSKPSTLKRVYV
jgi:hypothetical protein